MKTANDLLRSKGPEIWAVTPGSTVLEALKLMAEKNIGAVLVMDGATLAGILSERDYARKVILAGKNSSDTLVSEIMTPRVVCVRPDQSVDECMALMTSKHIRHLPVLDQQDRVAGVISLGDAVKAIIAEQQFVIAQLEHYIAGTDALANRGS